MLTIRTWSTYMRFLQKAHCEDLALWRRNWEAVMNSEAAPRRHGPITELQRDLSYLKCKIDEESYYVLKKGCGQ